MRSDDGRVRALGFAALAAFLAAVLALSACGQREESPPAAQPGGGAAAEGEPTSPQPPPAESPPAAAGGGAEAARAEAREIFATRCFTCHGPEGRGDGPASAGLQPPPRNFHDPEWQKSVTDDHLEKIILYGGAAVGRSPAMPPNPDLQSKPEVVAALVELIRGFGQAE